MKKNRIIIYILVGLLILVVGYLVIKFCGFATKVEDGSNNSKPSMKSNDELVSQMKTFSYKGYGYRLIDPNCYVELIDKEGEEYLHIFNNIDKWGANIRLVDKSKTNGIFDDYNRLEEYLKSSANGVIKNKQVKELNEMKFITFELHNENASGLLSYMRAYDNYEYEIVLYDGDNKTMNYDALDIVIALLNTRGNLEEIEK